MHNKGFKGRKEWEETQHNQVKKILSKAFSDRFKTDFLQVETANLLLDTKYSTDFLIKARRDNQDKYIKVASRIRRSTCSFRDLTIRTSYYGSENTEINKLQKAHFYFYAWTKNNKISEYMIIDIKKLFTSRIIEKHMHTEFNNTDDGNSFICIPAEELKDCCIIYNVKTNKYW